MHILSVDVGLRVCGYVVCEINKSTVNLIKEGHIKPLPKFSLSHKLSYIFEKLKKEIKLYKPKFLLVEKLYSHYRHPHTYGLLAQVRGVVILLAHHLGVSLFECSPTRIRKSFMGRGNVNSKQIKRMAENVTGRKFKSIHTADAFSLVVAFCHIQKVKRVLSAAH
jgi:crossover junction endodeoxyribonuclease RuvC